MMSKSPQEYLAAYQKLHHAEAPFLINGKEHRSAQLFDGSNFVTKLLAPFSYVVSAFSQQNRAVRVLDYGCGKASHIHSPAMPDKKTFFQYMEPHAVQVYWCYDPGFVEYSQKPPKQCFDIVICADVMEHVPESEVDKTLQEIGSAISGKGHVLFTISCKPAVKHFADGENLHVTVKDPDWWKDRIKKNMSRKHIYVLFETAEGNVEWKVSA